ncbi:hypothetical protein [Campylobacter helveticus]|uniref:hypothetical protein n=1 Tax=Campylobacter helveticus TaxID=28898 RepID=UPI0022EB948E|nr:hypothetical protein [Campylobacter helveticus]
MKFCKEVLKSFALFCFFLIELKNFAQGGNFDFLKEDSLEKKKEEALKELEESKKNTRFN